MWDKVPDATPNTSEHNTEHDHLELKKTTLDLKGTPCEFKTISYNLRKPHYNEQLICTIKTKPYN